MNLKSNLEWVISMVFNDQLINSINVTNVENKTVVDGSPFSIELYENKYHVYYDTKTIAVLRSQESCVRRVIIEIFKWYSARLWRQQDIYIFDNE